MRVLNFTRTLERAIRKLGPMLEAAYERPSWIYRELTAEPLGLKGPVTFEGTPGEVVRKLRRWQRGLEP